MGQFPAVLAYVEAGSRRVCLGGKERFFLDLEVQIWFELLQHQESEPSAGCPGVRIL